MSVLRPSAKVTGPDGREWEIYAFKLPLRRIRRPGRGKGRALVRWARALREWTAAAARALGSDEWTVEAVVQLPHRESYAWATTDEYKGQVLAQVEGHLARGDIPQRLGHATYLGAG